MKKLVVLTGAGVSAESGLKTFREMGGLWESYDVMEVASPEGWNNNMELVLRFYNERRAQLKDAKTNAGHTGLADLENFFDVHIITQNVDNLHEQAGSTKVLHLHGILTQVRSTGDASLVYDIGYKAINKGDTCDKGFQLRPNIVWFGEAVPAMEQAAAIASEADIFVVVGSSLVVYPAAGLVNYAPEHAPVFVVDPNEVNSPTYKKVEVIKEKAGKGIHLLKEKLIALK
ncbi:MAG TPA: NAD-dependent protein deacylase [Bacteroidales bacterium]|jgi:NAD-dependent deacetylase|nr:NAD-dependent protein deacylase [Bacteroidales bacterium]